MFRKAKKPCSYHKKCELYREDFIMCWDDVAVEYCGKYKDFAEGLA